MWEMWYNKSYVGQLVVWYICFAERSSVVDINCYDIGWREIMKSLNLDNWTSFIMVRGSDEQKTSFSIEIVNIILVYAKLRWIKL